VICWTEGSICASSPQRLLAELNAQQSEIRDRDARIHRLQQQLADCRAQAAQDARVLADAIRRADNRDVANRQLREDRRVIVEQLNACRRIVNTDGLSDSDAIAALCEVLRARHPLTAP
jgi:septal ring factor EnvC (AmiA/AmiB activator)